MPNDLDKFSGGILAKGISSFDLDFDPELYFNSDTFNVSSGIYQGVGPRYGMAPLAGQTGSALDDAGLPYFACMQAAESVYNSTFTREQFAGIVPLKIATEATYTTKATHYFFLYARRYGTTSESVIDCQPNYSNSAGTLSYSNDIRNPLVCAQSSTDPFESSPFRGNVSSTVKPSPTVFMSFDSISVAGADVPQQWLLGPKVSVGSVNATPAISLPLNFDPNPSAFNKLATFTTTPIRCYSLSSTKLEATYYASITPTSSIYIPVYYGGGTPTSIAAVSATANDNKRANGLTYANVLYGLWNDPNLTTNTGYKAVLVASSTVPTIFIIQDWYRGTLRRVSVPLFPCLPPIPPSRATEATGGGNYTVNGDRTQTCFFFWPSHVFGTALPTDAASAYNGTIHVTLGAANTGVLRANTAYEITYSLFDKRIGRETNVGLPATVMTGSDDFVRLSIFRDSKTAGVFDQTIMANNTVPTCCLGSTTLANSIVPQGFTRNYTQYRFYYRALGSYEWLPTLQIDAMQLFAYPDNQVLWICEAPIGALPGGQPGGFVDYSPLPQDDYIDVKTFKNRAFWFTRRGFTFSLRDNIFSYPARNNTTFATGECLGATLHNYPGEAEQQGRLIIWGTKENYIGRFTGVQSEAPVQVSPDEIGTFPVDGSDFNVEPWTSVTAYSHRSACVANGILYYWGPQGVYVDDGTNTPPKISEALEPDIFRYVDPGSESSVSSTYNEQTHEITWFYPPRVSDGNGTHTLIYNTRTQEFLRGRIAGRIDAVQKLNITDSIGTGGDRTLVSARYTAGEPTQRAYFYDGRCMAGDMRPTADFVVSTFSTPSTGTRRLTLATGYDPTNFATIAAGDLITIRQFTDYTAQVGDDFVGLITALGVGTIDILVPTGATFPASPSPALTRATYFPIYHKAAASNGLNSFTWQIKTNYWMPGGMNYFGIWKWLYMLSKITLLKSPSSQTFTVSYRTPISGDELTDTVTLSNNSDGHFQLYHPLRTGNMNNQGQAIKYTISGSQIGSLIVLQYLEQHATEESGNVLKMFEG